MIGSLLLLLAAPAGLWAPQTQEPSWTETQFHRVHLLNGNFIDGQLLKNTSQGATLRLKAGEITIRQDLIDRIEFIKMRSLSEPPPKTPPATPKREPPAAKVEGTPPAAGTPSKLPALNPGSTDPETRSKVDALLRTLRKSTPDARGDVAREISDLGPKAPLYLGANLEALEDDLLTYIGPLLTRVKSPQMVDLLAAQTKSQRASVRSEAAAGLGRLEEASAWQTLIPLLKDPDIIVRGVAADALGNLNAPEAIGPLSKITIDPDRSLRLRSFAALQRLLSATGKSGDLRRILVELAEQAQGVARAEVLTNLARQGAREDWTPIARYLSDGESSVRQAAAFALSNLAVPESADEILSRLPIERDKWARIYLAGAALKLKSLRAIDALIPWMSDEDVDVRTASYQALRGLTSQSIEPKRELWETYWSSARDKILKP